MKNVQVDSNRHYVTKYLNIEKPWHVHQSVSARLSQVGPGKHKNKIKWPVLDNQFMLLYCH